MKKVISVLLAFGFVLQLGLLSAFAAPKVSVTSVKVTPISIKWAVGNTATLKAVVAPTTATTKTVSWKSSNPAIVSVDSTGKVRALALGTATITCTAKDGSGKKATCAATVTAPKTIKEIVTFYNNTANATKAYKGTIKVAKTSGTISVVNYVAYSWAVKSLAEKMLPNDYVKEPNKTFKNGKEVGGTSTLVKHLPRDKDAKMSVLETAGVKSATCVKSGSGWKILITLKSETVNSLNAKPKYHSQCMDTLSMTDADLAPFTLLKATVTYTDKTTINAVVNAKGLLNSVKILEPAQIKGDLTYPPLNFQLKNTDVTGNFKDEYVFTYVA